MGTDHPGGSDRCFHGVGTVGQIELENTRMMGIIIINIGNGRVCYRWEKLNTCKVTGIFTPPMFTFVL